MIHRIAALVVAVALATTATSAQSDTNWPQFRGAHARGWQDGHATPVRWNAAPEKDAAPTNVRWKVELPGLGHSCPAIWGDRLFITTAVNESGEHPLRVGLYGDIKPVADASPHTWKVYCLDKHTGAVLWQRDAVTGVPKVKRHPKATHANCTIATDGEHVVAFFGSEGLYCYDLDGALKWKKDLGVLDAAFFRVPAAQWEFASSPVLHDGRVYVQCDVLENSFLAAFDARDGREIWRTKRDDVPTWSTPTIHVDGDRTLLLVNGYRHIGGYDAMTGEELWKMAGKGDIPTPTPVVADGLVYISQSHGGGSPIYAIGLDARGEIPTPANDEGGQHVAWSRAREGAYMPTPIVYRGLLYVLRDRGTLACYDPKTGERHYRTRVGEGGGFTASAVAGDGKLYLASETGVVHVVKAGTAFELLASNPMGEPMLATPAISAGTLYVRTKQHVVAIAETEKRRTAAVDDTIRDLHARLLDKKVGPLVRDGDHPSVAVGIIGMNGALHMHAAFGTLDGREDGPAASETTLYEIGSVTKVFTAMLLAIAADRGEVGIDDPVRDHLPDEVSVPTHGDRPITLGELADHTSGLPRIPKRLAPKNPYARYDRAMLHADLGTIRIDDPNPGYAYSNLGHGLLGDVLAQKAGSNYETLVRTTIADPLGMPDTVLAIDTARRPRFARPFAANGKPGETWEFDALAGCGAVRSTVADMLVFVAAHLEPSDALAAPVRAMRTKRHTIRDRVGVALGWHTLTFGPKSPAVGETVWWHNGRTGGYASFCAIHPASKSAVVMLTNRSKPVDRVGFEILALLIDGPGIDRR